MKLSMNFTIKCPNEKLNKTFARIETLEKENAELRSRLAVNKVFFFSFDRFIKKGKNSFFRKK